MNQPGVRANPTTGGSDYFDAAGHSVDPFAAQHECPGCHRLVWLASHQCN